MKATKQNLIKIVGEILHNQELGTIQKDFLNEIYMLYYEKKLKSLIGEKLIRIEISIGTIFGTKIRIFNIEYITLEKQLHYILNISYRKAIKALNKVEVENIFFHNMNIK
jgi:hypothetical protein